MLLFIWYLLCHHLYCHHVSIHLMLLFIEIKALAKLFVYMFQYISCCYLSKNGEVSCKAQQSKFQYISCCYLSNQNLCPCRTYHVSIHLMLLFIFISAVINPSLKKVSIHLMLLFISWCVRFWVRRTTSFNTSHVVIYQNMHTLPFLFPEFQYISCCYLSQVFENMEISSHRFNTSHVVIYP